MGYSKRQFVEAAYAEIGMAGYVFDLSPEDLQLAVRRLDSMMAEWNGRGIVISYPLPVSPQNGDLTEASNVPDWANEAIILGLALRLAPGEGKVASPDTKTNAANAFNTVVARCVRKTNMQLPSGTPSGAGNRQIPYQSPFLTDPVVTEVEPVDVDIEFAK